MRKEDSIRRMIAQEAARLMYEDGVREYRDAKRKAARQFGSEKALSLGSCLPSNADDFQWWVDILAVTGVTGWNCRHMGECGACDSDVCHFLYLLSHDGNRHENASRQNCNQGSFLHYLFLSESLSGFIQRRLQKRA
jgi:hypothetical protein